MSRQLLKVIVAGTACAALVTACSDRFGSYQSRKTSCEQYNEYARANSKPLKCQPVAGLAKGPNGTSSVEPTLSRTQPTNGLDTKPDPAGVPRPPAPGSGVSGGDVVIDNSSGILNGPTLESPYAKADWMTEFNKEIVSTNASAPNMIQGITVTTTVENNKAMVSIEAVVMFDGKPYMMMFSQPKAEVKFDETRISKIKVDVRENKDAPADVRLTDQIFVSATCMVNPGEGRACPDYGLVVDFKVSPTKSPKGRVWAAFRITAGEGDAKSGVAKSNLGSEMRSFGEAYGLFSTTPAPGISTGTVVAPGPGVSAGPGVSGGPQGQVEPRDSEYAGMVLETTKTITAQNQIVIKAKADVEKAKTEMKIAAGQQALKDAQAALKKSQDAYDIIINQNIVEQILNAELKQEKKLAMVEVLKMLELSRKLVAEIKVIADSIVQPISGGPALRNNPDPEGTADITVRTREAEEAEARRRDEMMSDR